MKPIHCGCYTIWKRLIPWLCFGIPDCPHCAKELPALARLYPEYKALGLKVVTICGKREGLVESCWKGRDEMQLPSAWYYWADPTGASMFQVIYNVYTIPAMYLLDDNRHIIYGSGATYMMMSWNGWQKHIKAKWDLGSWVEVF